MTKDNVKTIKQLLDEADVKWIPTKFDPAYIDGKEKK